MPQPPNPDTNKTCTHDWCLIFIAWLIAACGTLGALFFGEVMGIAPCTLCWYQRIFMFPLAIFLPLALFPLDTKVIRYALPLAMLGLGFAIYHWLLQLGIIPATTSPCSQGSSCSEVSAQWFGFLTIPLMSVFAFALINIALLATLIREK
ncbi:disulfide bond formation protein B [Chitinibacter fontanus]|uniref:Disulfide bond formation protein B n=1 Tax=Chitinibacter fontanus TaxID=1737446 RepID=A0A7D5V8X9_9NEIS|nr:disulfide bond formation protein B [Chitinibacter fontanus]QLI81055.1 disulfide bond formation protein B [Chitinibacter fontanus]